MGGYCGDMESRGGGGVTWGGDGVTCGGILWGHGVTWWGDEVTWTDIGGCRREMGHVVGGMRGVWEEMGSRGRDMGGGAGCGETGSRGGGGGDGVTW